MAKTKILINVVCVMLSWASFTMADGAADNLAQALRFKTISHQDASKTDKAAFLALHQFLRDTYPKSFAQLNVEIINELSLLLIWQGADESLEPILFTAHMDVVPIEPGTEDGWKHPPFEGVIDGGVIYGRGALDDKVGVISLLESSEKLLAEGYQPNRTVVFAFGHDEEVSGPNGAARIAERLKELDLYFTWMIDEGGSIMTDHPTLPNRNVAVINVAEKAYYTLRLTATGEGGHSSTPPAHTSVGKLASALSRIENNPFESRLEEPIKSMLETFSPHLEFLDRMALSNLWLTGSLVVGVMEESRAGNAQVRTTTAVTMFNGGVKENVVPQTAEAVVNFRLLPGDTTEMVLNRIIELVDDPDITIEPIRKEPATPPVADMNGGGYAVISKAVKTVYPEAVVVPSLLSGATDVRHYVDLADNHYRFHGVATQMADMSGVHGTDEKVGVESFENAIDIAVEMIRLGSQ
jgi:carboxypeptidase PM20D1